MPISQPDSTQGKILAIVGPTATGKTNLALKLAKSFTGELISCDSRQVYRGMDIVTGKDIPSKSQIKIWGLDLVEPDEEFSAAHWVKMAEKAIRTVWSADRLPIIVGGTGFWLKALLHKVKTLGIPPDYQLRQKLADLDVSQLFSLLTKMDPAKTASMNQSDKNNPRRLVRAIEVAKYHKSALSVRQAVQRQALFGTIGESGRVLKIGLRASLDFLDQQIKKRVYLRWRQGAADEARQLVSQGYDFSLPSMTACGYPLFQDYWSGLQTATQTKQKWFIAERQYARRQLVWFAKDPKIIWFDISQKNWQDQVVQPVKNWYDK
jgi:tRNA dimethylallyltransferase